MSTTRYAIRIDRQDVNGRRETHWIFRLDRYTAPAWTQAPSAAMTWASKASALVAARRYNLQNYTIDPLERRE
jgi:hypothetical protein